MKNLNIKNSKLNLLLVVAVAVVSMLFALLFTNTAYADCDSVNPQDIESIEVLKDPTSLQAPVNVPVTLNVDILALGNNLQVPVNAAPYTIYPAVDPLD